MLGKATCCQAAELARGLRSGDRLARSAVAYGRAFSFGIVDQVLIHLIDEALRALPEGDSLQRAQLLARQASAMQPANDPTRPMALARDAIAMARRLDDEPTLLAVLYGAMSALSNFAPGSERSALDREAIDLATRLGEPLIRLRSTYRLILDHLDEGDFESARTQNSVYQVLAAGFRQPRVHFEAKLLRSLFALHAGQIGEHLAVLAELREPLATSELPSGELYLEGHELRARLQIEDSWTEHRDRFLTLYRAGWQPLYGLTGMPFLDAHTGELEQARAAFALVDLHAVVRYQDLLVLWMVAETAIRLDDRATAATLDETLARHEGRWCTSGLPLLMVEGPITQVRFRLAAFLERTTEARAHARAMLVELRAAGSPLLLARGLVAWATSAVCDRTEAAAALAEARTIATTHELPIRTQIDAHLARRAPVPAPAPTPTPETETERVMTAARDGDTWLMVLGAVSCRVKDSRGMGLLAKLLDQPGRELHVLELVGAMGVDAGDAGEVIDRAAVTAYRARAQQLRAELEEAEAFNDLGRRARAEAELEQLETELRAGTGLGGRPRKTTGAAERARINVRRRIADAITRITEHAPALGEHLDVSIRTGAFCSYDPRRTSS